MAQILHLFDLRTTALLTGIVALIMWVVLLSVYRGYASTVQGITHWVAGSLAVGLGPLLIGLRGVVPLWVSSVFGNFLFICGLGLMLIGTQRFYGRTPTWKWFWAAVIGATGGVCWWMLIQPNYGMRLICVSAMSAALCGAPIWPTRSTTRLRTSFVAGTRECPRSGK